jgi:hypothetical protein
MSRWNQVCALLDIPTLPSEAFKHVGDRKIKPQGGGGGGQTTSYQTNIPEYAKQPFMDLVGKSEALSNQPYQAFGGQRIEGFTPMQQQAQTQAANQGVAGQIGAATNLAGAASTNSFTNPGIAGAYMSPYMQNVVEMQQRDATRQAGIAGTQRAADFTKSGAFGGSRQAIMDAEAARNLALQQGDIQARGLQSAFESGQGQFNNEMNRGLAGANALGQLGQQQFGQQMDITRLQDTMGGQQQALGQRQLDQQYADFQAQRDYPYQQLGFLSDILRGTSGSTRTMYESKPQAGTLQNLAGLGSLAASFAEGGVVGGAPEYSSGGITEPLALPARLRTLSDQQLVQFSEQNKEDLFSMALAKSESDARARLRQAGPQAQAPQGTVMDEVAAEMAPAQMGGIADAAPDMEFADGGIVGYADGGDISTIPGFENRDPRIGGILAGARQRAPAPAASTTPAQRQIVLPAGTPWQELEQVRLANPDAAVTTEDMGGAWKGLAKALKYSSDVEAEKAPAVAPYGMGNEGRREPMGPTAEKGLPLAIPKETPAPQNNSAPSSAGAGGSAGASSSTRGGIAGAPAFDPEAMTKPLYELADKKALADKEAAEGALADLDASVAARGVYGKDKEERIKAQQDKLAGGEEKARKMAFLQAGLAILGADPSRGGLAAIAEGAGKGVAQYRGDINKLEEKRQGMLDKLDQISDLRRQESMADSKERRAIQLQIRGLKGAAIAAHLDIAKGTGVELNKEAAKMAQERYLTDLKIKADRENTRIMAASRASSADGNDRQQRDADAAFARNPEVAMLKKQAENPMTQMDPLKQQQILNRLRAIQAETFAQYGVKMATPPGQPAGNSSQDPLGLR